MREEKIINEMRTSIVKTIILTNNDCTDKNSNITSYEADVKI